MQEVLTAMGVPILTMAGYEADDILGTVAKRCQAEGEEVSVVSGDRDLLQLADTHIKIRIPKTSRGTTEIHDYYPEDVKREYQVTPMEFIDVKALMGDSSDNIPGVPSIGEKTATNLIVAYGSIENAYAHLDEVKPPRARKALEEHYDMAVMSKELAQICITCPIPFVYEDAKIENLYTPEAYQYMKRLEFKSILARFDVQEMGGNSVEEHFWSVEDLSGAEQIFEKARNAEQVGCQLIFSENGVAGLTICIGEEEIYTIPAAGFLTGSYLCDHLEELIAQRRPNQEPVAVLDLKPQLPYLNLDYGSAVVDMGVAGYLLNPLKDAYEYDDLARDYLGMTVPSRTDLLGKQSLAKALEAEAPEAVTCGCYMAYVAYKAAGVLKSAWKTRAC